MWNVPADVDVKAGSIVFRGRISGNATVGYFVVGAKGVHPGRRCCRGTGLLRSLWKSMNFRIVFAGDQ